MTSDGEDALSWEGDDRPDPAPRPALPHGWNAVGRGSENVARGSGNLAPVEHDDAVAESEGPATTQSSVMLLLVGVFAGVYLLYTVGWVIGGLNMKPLANLIVADAMYMPWFVLAVAAPALWLLAAWVLTRGRAAWIRVLLLFGGAVLLVPWPFVMVGVSG